ncbi:hypothetical protein QYM36_003293 [Artemia franciscana]|uniref:Uncharacterized protein n=1 Tax=Artemia franciscana TaxID=6661 RepID=A0AA88I726_ARTSF|nr:hypothetical protein QYM36_003293 [Artemia franciscana]
MYNDKSEHPKLLPTQRQCHSTITAAIQSQSGLKIPEANKTRVSEGFTAGLINIDSQDIVDLCSSEIQPLGPLDMSN